MIKDQKYLSDSLLAKITVDPYPLYVEENFLSEVFYNNIKNDFNEILKDYGTYDEDYNAALSNKKTAYLTIGGGRSENSNSKIKNVFKKSSSWTLLLNYFDSNEFVDTIINSFRKKYKANKKVFFRKANYKQNIFQKIFQDNVYMTFKISKYPSGSGMSYHRDFDDKYLSGLFYLGFSDGKNRKVGGTQFYKEKNKLLKIDHYADDPDIFELWNDVSPDDNKLVIFMKTDNSWHKVEPFELSHGVTRNNLQINLMHCHYDYLSSKIIKFFKGLIFPIFQLLIDEIRSLIFVLKENQTTKYNKEIVIEEDKYIIKSKKNFLKTEGSFWLLRNIYYFFKNSFLIFDKKRRRIRKIVLKNCLPVKKNIYLKSGYGIDLNGIKPNSNVFSFGIYDDINFEKFLYEKMSLKVFLADPTPVSKKFMQNKIKDNFNYLPCAINTYSGKVKFYFSSSNHTEDTMEGSINNINNQNKFLEVDCLTLEDFKKKWNCDVVDFVKMDIEGSAVDILRYLISKPNKILMNQIACEIEFPNLDMEPNFHHKINGLLACLKTYYKIYYIPRHRRYTNLEILLVKKTN